jgi:hypothetical protein
VMPCDPFDSCQRAALSAQAGFEVAPCCSAPRQGHR